MNEMITSPIKWAGGKRWIVTQLQKLYTGGRIVEPFCGGCSVTLGLAPKKALLNDLNPALILFWHHVARGGRLDNVGGNDEIEYYKVREEFNRKLAIVHSWEHEKMSTTKTILFQRHFASEFYYLNRSCFNGLYRVNKKGIFNVPFGQYKTINYKDSFPDVARIARDYIFTHGSYDKVKTNKSDFIYVDPPYDTESSASFVDFTGAGFDWAAQIRLANWCAFQPGLVVASNSATPRIIKLYRSLGFKVKLIDAPRRISSDGDRRNVKEILAIKQKSS